MRQCGVSLHTHWDGYNLKQKISDAEEVEKLKPSYTGGKNVKWFSGYGKQFGSSSKS